jgi:hypothetical protein
MTENIHPLDYHLVATLFDKVLFRKSSVSLAECGFSFMPAASANFD